VHHPSSEAELAALIRQAPGSVKVAGSGHSCGPIAAADDGTDLVLLDRLDSVLSFTGDDVTVEGGMPLHRLNGLLAQRGRALVNMGSIAEQTVAGAISTGTHGTGLSVGALDHQVTGLRLVDAAGDVHDARGDLLAAARVSLGALGVISAVTIRHVPAFDLNAVSQRSTLDETFGGLEEMLEAPYFRFWWFPHTNLTQTWLATPAAPSRRAEKSARWGDFKGNRVHEAALWAASLAPRATPAVNRLAARWLIGGDGRVSGRSDRVFTFPIRVRQHVMEWGVPVSRAAEAVRAVTRMVERTGFFAHAPVEVRFAPADDAWLSMAHGRATCYIGVISYRPFGREVEHEPYFREVDRVMADFGGRPHWAKVHYRDQTTLAGLYPRWADFADLRGKLDPTGLFLNAELRRLFGQ
jgi:L-gulonolactone oxidase